LGESLADPKQEPIVVFFSTTHEKAMPSMIRWRAFCSGANDEASIGAVGIPAHAYGPTEDAAIRRYARALRDAGFSGRLRRRG
jgi:hypothetical protein